MEARHVDDDVLLAEVARQPAPAIHVEADAVRAWPCRVAGVVASAALSAAYCGCDRQQVAQRARDIVLRERRAQQRVLLGGVEIGVDDVPVDPRRALDMAEREVGRNAVEAVGRCARQRHRIAGAHRGHQAVGIIIGRVQPLAADLPGCNASRSLRVRWSHTAGGNGGGGGAALAAAGRACRTARPCRASAGAGLGSGGRRWLDLAPDSARLRQQPDQRQRCHCRDQHQGFRTRHHREYQPIHFEG